MEDKRGKEEEGERGEKPCVEGPEVFGTLSLGSI